MTKTPRKGSCPICFTQYYYKMKAEKVGKAALQGTKGLTEDDFETNYRDFHVLLNNSSLMGVSVCLTCYVKLDDETVKVAFNNTLTIDVEDIKTSRLSEEQKKDGIAVTKKYSYVFWSNDVEEVLEKRNELFPNL